MIINHSLLPKRFLSSTLVLVFGFIIQAFIITSNLSAADWKSSAPEEQGMSSIKLAEGIEYILGNDLGMHSMLVIRNGYIVLDVYFYPFTPDTKHDVASVTKSFTSTLIGIAIEKGFIKSIEQPILDFFSDYTVANLDSLKEEITIEDLLTMQSGLHCINQPTEMTLFQMMGSPDWVQFMLDLPMVEKPGFHFNYNSGGIHLLSAIIQKATGKSALAFAEEHLFKPLEITDVSWPYDPQDINNFGWGSLRIKPHDMAKLGYLFLNKGYWKNQQIISPGWIENSTKRHVNFKGKNGYGYLWWIEESGFSARGRGGQYVIVVPELNIISVFTGNQGGIAFKILKEFIIPAVESGKSLLPNPTGVELLSSKIELASIAPEFVPEPVPAFPEISKEISGKTFNIEDNMLGLQNLTLYFDNPEEAILELTLTFDIDKDEDVKYVIGLDNVPHISNGRFGIPTSSTGFWETENKFIIEVDEVGNINQFHIELSFREDQLHGTIAEKTGLGSIFLKGKLDKY